MEAPHPACPPCPQLERRLAPGRPPSSTVAVNRRAQFLPHKDSGGGAGQSTSLIAALGDFTARPPAAACYAAPTAAGWPQNAAESLICRRSAQLGSALTPSLAPPNPFLLSHATRIRGASWSWRGASTTCATGGWNSTGGRSATGRSRSEVLRGTRLCGSHPRGWKRRKRGRGRRTRARLAPTTTAAWCRR